MEFDTLVVEDEDRFYGNLHRGWRGIVEYGQANDVKSYVVVLKYRYKLKNGKTRFRFNVLGLSSRTFPQQGRDEE